VRSSLSAPPVLDRAASVLARYDALFCDVWGVVHDGLRAYEPAGEALARFRGLGGTVVLITNAPVPRGRVAAMLDRVALRRDAWDAIVSSGDIALGHIAERGYRRLACIGPRDRDWALFRELSAGEAAVEAADAILCSGLEGENETAESHRPILEKARARGLPFVCANPDLVVDVGGARYLCAGAVADLYERMGGDVFWAGKPHASAYGAARAAAEGLRGSPLDPARILAIGDSLRTDIAGAAAAGLDALFIAGGIHRGDLMDRDAISPERLARLFSPPAPRAVAAMAELAW